MDWILTVAYIVIIVVFAFPTDYYRFGIGVLWSSFLFFYFFKFASIRKHQILPNKSALSFVDIQNIQHNEKSFGSIHNHTQFDWASSISFIYFKMVSVICVLYWIVIFVCIEMCNWSNKNNEYANHLEYNKTF